MRTDSNYAMILIRMRYAHNQSALVPIGILLVLHSHAIALSNQVLHHLLQESTIHVILTSLLLHQLVECDCALCLFVTLSRLQLL